MCRGDHWSPADLAQQRVFPERFFTDKRARASNRKQLDIAQKYNKPIIVHSRDSIQDTYNILKEYNLKGSIHCFSGSVEMAREFIKLGYKIGIGGIITYKNAKTIKEVVDRKERRVGKECRSRWSPYH